MSNELENSLEREMEDAPMLLEEGSPNNEPGAVIPKDVERKLTNLRIREKYFIFSIMGLILISFLLLTGYIWVFLGWWGSGDLGAKPFHESVQVAKIVSHLNNLQNFAVLNNGSRSPMNGYNVSGEYVIGLLSPLYKVSKQYFEVSDWAELDHPKFSSNQREFIYEKEFRNFMYSASANITGKMTLIPFNGCEIGHFQNFVKGTIALIQRGNCTFGTKTGHAMTSGAIGVIVFNIEPSVLQASLYAPYPIPVFSVSSTIGDELKNSISTLIVSMYSKTKQSTHSTFNILAETKVGSEDDILVVGAHLDSVAKGPGINDNGSGSMSVLEIALQLALRMDEVKNKVVFAFWGAEELGLIGSTFYVDSLNAKQRSQIALNLNFDMIASPNYIRGVYNGASAKLPSIRKPSVNAQKVFEDFYTERKLGFEMSEFDGRSDYGPFIEIGIPASGLDSGAEKIKTKGQHGKAGGIEGVAFDPCYHLSCDTIFNVNVLALSEASQCAAKAVYFFATNDDLRGYLNK